MFAKRILDRYQEDKKPLPVITNQKTNDYLKEIGEMIGLKEHVKVKRWINSQLVESYVPKFEVLTCHVARKTFATNSLILGMTEAETKAITGYRDPRSFRRYVNIADESKKLAMQKAWSEDTVLKSK